MIQKFLVLAAVISLSAGITACGSDDIEGSLPPAKPAVEGEAPAGDGMAAQDMAADETMGEETMTEEVTSEETVVEEVSPEGVETEETMTETVMTEEEAAPPGPTVEERMAAREMLRDVRHGSYAIRYCQDIDDVNLKTFDDCVASQLTTADLDGELTDGYKLGADYQAWLFLGEHAREMHDKGYEWTKEYRTVFKSRAKYQKSVQNLIYSTGLDEREVCAQLSGEC